MEWATRKEKRIENWKDRSRAETKNLERQKMKDRLIQRWWLFFIWNFQIYEIKKSPQFYLNYQILSSQAHLFR